MLLAIVVILFAVVKKIISFFSRKQYHNSYAYYFLVKLRNLALLKCVWNSHPVLPNLIFWWLLVCFQ